jgi:hypothetical protein
MKEKSKNMQVLSCQTIITYSKYHVKISLMLAEVNYKRKQRTLLGDKINAYI